METPFDHTKLPTIYENIRESKAMTGTSEAVYILSDGRGDSVEILIGEFGRVVFIHDNFPRQRKSFATDIPFATFEDFERAFERMNIPNGWESKPERYDPYKPKIVCLCGSTKFKDAFLKAQMDETMKGNIVLSVGGFMHADGHTYTDQEKINLDNLHRAKIEMADEIFVLNVNGYIGESTLSEITFAIKKGKTIGFLEPDRAYTKNNQIFIHPPSEVEWVEIEWVLESPNGKKVNQ